MSHQSDTLRDNIFICHSSHDEDALGDLRIHLNPLFESGAIRIWEDSMLFSGGRWNDAIRAAIKRSVGAVFLVSPHLLNSEYVRNVEIPEFLRLAEQARLRIYCLYLTHSVVEQVEFTFKMNGAPVTRRLTEYHGLNSPREPLSDNKRDRNRILASAAKRIYADVRNGKSPRTFVGVVDRPPRPKSRSLYVALSRTVEHPRYGKRQKRTTVLAVHWDENQRIVQGDLVEIMESRPMSKKKHHILLGKVSN